MMKVEKKELIGAILIFVFEWTFIVQPINYFFFGRWLVLEQHILGIFFYVVGCLIYFKIRDKSDDKD